MDTLCQAAYSLGFDVIELDLWAASHVSIKRVTHYAPNWFNCLIVFLFGQSRASIIFKMWEIDAVMKRKDGNCVGILSDQGEAATASNLGE